jgi:dsRNA-specific ribonuclease
MGHPEITHIVQSTVDSKAQLSAAAARTGIEGCIKLCRASGPASPYVVSQALRAIIGAVWKDCGSHVAVNRIIARLKCVKRAMGDFQAATDDVQSMPGDVLGNAHSR